MSGESGWTRDLLWSDLRIDDDGDFRFSVERDSEAIDVYTIPTSQGGPLLAALQSAAISETLENAGATDQETVQLAWDRWIGRDLALLATLGISVRQIGLYVSSGDFLDYFPIEELDA